MSKNKEAVPSQRGSLWKEVILPVLLALVAALVIRTAFIEAFRIPSGSMVPTLAIGDHIFVNKLSYRLEVPYRIFQFRVPGGGTTLIRWGEPKRGDVAVFRFPRDPMIDFVKRIVAMPGDEVEVQNGVVFINGQRQEREDRETVFYQDRDCSDHAAKLSTETNLDGMRFTIQMLPGVQPLENMPRTKVPEGHYFAMGDNRDNSEDSRAWGFIPYANLKGRALFVWLSYDKCGDASHKFRGSRMFRKVHREAPLPDEQTN